MGLPDSDDVKDVVCCWCHLGQRIVVWLRSCQPCETAFNAVKRAVRRKSKASAEPTKSSTSLAACGAEKLRVQGASGSFEAPSNKDWRRWSKH